MRATIAAIGILALAACGGEAPPAGGAETGDHAPGELAARDNCKDIGALAAAMSEPEPFASLRSGNVVQGGAALDGHYETAVAPAGASCSMGRMDGFGDDAGMMYVVNCELFSSGMMDREENGVKAKEIFDKAKAQMEQCLPAGWTARDGNNNGFETTEALIYETPEDVARSESSNFYVYPIELIKEWSDGSGRGQFPGWKVKLNFQKEVPKADAPADPAPAQ